MKKIFTFLFAATLVMPMFATELLKESFDYTVDNSLSNATNWTLGTGTATNHKIVSDNLTSANYCPQASGKAVAYSSGSCIDYRQFTGQTSGALYMSALINVNTVSSGKVGTIFALGSSNSSTYQYGRVIVKTVDNGYQLGIAKYTESTTYMRYSNTLELNKTYLVVVRYNFVAGEKNDEAYLWIDPISTSESTPTVKFTQDTTSSEGNPLGAFKCADPQSLSYIHLQSGSNQPTSMIIDEIRIATTWADLGITDGEEEEEEEDPQPELSVNKSALEFKDFTAGETPSLTFTVSGANLTEDITISSESSAFSFSPASISKEDAGTPTTVTVTLSATQATDFSNQTITIASGELNKTVTVKGNVYIPELVEIPAFSFLLNQQDTEGKIYNYAGTAAKILSVDSELKQIILKDTKSVKVQISDADWAANTYAEGMKVTKFVFTAEIMLGGQLAICTPITLTFAAPNFSREMTSTNLATICLKGDVSNFAQLQEQATFYKILCKQEYEGEVYNIILEEVNTNMEAGKPYIFQPKEPCTLKFYYSAATDFAGSENGLIGTFTNMDIDEGMFLVSNNMFCKAGTGCTLAANRAYINMDQVPAEEDAQPKVGMRQLSLQNADKRMPTELAKPMVSSQAQKFIVKGKLMFKKNNNFYNAQGQIVK